VRNSLTSIPSLSESAKRSKWFEDPKTVPFIFRCLLHVDGHIPGVKVDFDGVSRKSLRIGLFNFTRAYGVVPCECSACVRLFSRRLRAQALWEYRCHLILSGRANLKRKAQDLPACNAAK